MKCHKSCISSDWGANGWNISCGWTIPFYLTTALQNPTAQARQNVLSWVTAYCVPSRKKWQLAKMCCKSNSTRRNSDSNSYKISNLPFPGWLFVWLCICCMSFIGWIFHALVVTLFSTLKTLCHSHAMLLTKPHPCSMTSAMAATSNSWNTTSLSELFAFLLRHKVADERVFFNKGKRDKATR